MTRPKLPESLLARHPELEQVEEALECHRRGEPVTIDCIRCGGALEVVEVRATGSLSVICPKGCTRFRAVRRPD